MAIWHALRSLSTRRLTRSGSTEREADRKHRRPRNLRMEKFEDRVLLSISPTPQPRDVLWQRTIDTAIERAANLENYTPEELDSTDRWAVTVSDGYSSAQLAATVGADSLRAMTYLASSYVWEFPANLTVGEEKALLAGISGGVTSYYPLVAQQIEPLLIPNDPLFVDQWHLLNTGQTGGTPGYDANVTGVWDNYLGTGVVIGIVDDGMDYLHPDLANQYRADLSYDFYFDDPDPMHDLPWDGHGTCVAGVAGAQGNNGLGVSGAAPGAQLAAVRTWPWLDDDITAAELSYHLQDIDIYNNSWGPGNLLVGPGPATLNAIYRGVTTGRGGLGNIYVWSAGNSGDTDNVNFSGYQNSRFGIAVAAIDHDGVRASYSEPGAPLLISAYSLGDENVGITTTDWLGLNGFSPTDYFDSFSGTSSSAPLVSGVIALILEANPNLTYRDVQHILVNSARHNDPNHPDWTTNAAGHEVNHVYGFGAIDAGAAVSLAETWTNVGEELWVVSGVDNVGTAVPDGNAAGISRQFNMPAAFSRMEWAEVVFDADHVDPNDLEIVLISPQGTRSVLAQAGTSLWGVNYDNWTFTSARNWGESPEGEWTLQVIDTSGNGLTGNWNSWQLRLYGEGDIQATIPPELVTIFTAEDEILYTAATHRPVNGVITIPEVLERGPRELTLRFAEGQRLDPTTLAGGIQILRTGGDDTFGNPNDVNVEIGWIGLGDRENEVIVRFAETLPDDLYRVYLIGDPAAPSLPPAIERPDEPLMNRGGLPFHDGRNLEPIQFDLDLGALVTAVVPQPISRDRIVTAPTGAQIAASTVPVTFTVRGGVREVMFEFTLAGAQPGTGRLPVVYTANDTAAQVAASIKAAIEAAVVSYPDLRLSVVQDPVNQSRLTLSGLWSEFDQENINVNIAVQTSGTPRIRVDDKDRFIVGDDTRTLTFEFDMDTAPGVSAGNIAVPITQSSTATDIASAIVAAIAGEGMHLTATIVNNQIRLQGVDVVFDFDARVLPFTFETLFGMAEGALHQERSAVEVYFNDDTLTSGGTLPVDYFTLIATNNTADTRDDVAHVPQLVEYNAGTNKAVLWFDVDDLTTWRVNTATDQSEAFRLRIGEVYRPIEVSTTTIFSDAGSSFATALDRGWHLGSLAGGGVGAQSLVIRGTKIEPSQWDQIYTMPWPGGVNEPGHRNMPDFLYRWMEDGYWQGGNVGDPEPGITTVEYNFRDDYAGTVYSNAITDDQKERTREAFELLGHYLGVQFVETFPEPGVRTDSITIATGDVTVLRWMFLPILPTPYGAVAGVASPAGMPVEVYGSSDGGGLPIRVAIMSADVFEDPVDEYGEDYFLTAMHEILTVLGVGHSYDSPELTVSGIGQEEIPLTLSTAEPVFPGDVDIVHGQHLYRPDSNDIDLYKFTLDTSGVFSAETLAERLDDVALRDHLSQRDSSLLDTVITLYGDDPNDDINGPVVLSQNDDFYSEDSFVEMWLPNGTYYVAVTSTGNTNFDPVIENSGAGGTSQGDYELRLSFRPDPDQDDTLKDATGQMLDGDADGVEGGNYNFWFNVQSQARTLVVDKSVANTTGNGTLAAPYKNIPQAFAAARPGDLVRVVGNAGADGDPDRRIDNLAYEVGRNLYGNTLSDDWRLEVPRGVTMMVDGEAIFKLRGANLDVGSSAHNIDRSLSQLQVLGTPGDHIYFTSYFNEMLGYDTQNLSPALMEADWGGLVFRNQIDYEDGRAVRELDGIFLNYVNHADISYGGGQVRVNSVLGLYNPVYMATSRPTISYNYFHDNADSALSANPDSFRDNTFQDYYYRADFDRVGPDIDGNRLVGNSINGLMVRVVTPSMSQADKLHVTGRFDDSDIVHVVSKNLLVDGTPGGAKLLDGTTPLRLPAVNRILAADGLHLTDGDYFTITTVDPIDGQRSATFEFDATGGVIYGRRRIPFVPSADPGEGSVDDVAREIAQAINSMRPALLVTDTGGYVHEVDVTNPRLTSQFHPRIGNLDGGAALVNGEIYMAQTGGPNQELVVYSRGGAPVDRIPMPYRVVTLGGEDLAGGAVGRLFAVPADGTDSIVELDPITGAEVRRYGAPAASSGLPTDGLALDSGTNTLYYLSGSGDQLFLLNPNTGNVVRSLPLPPGDYAGLAVVEGRVFAINNAVNDIVEIDLTTGAATRLNIVTGGVILGTSLTGLPAALPANQRLNVTATPNGPFVELYVDRPYNDADPNAPFTVLLPNGLAQQRAQLDARLAIDPGVIVKLNEGRLEAEIGTQLIAEGEKDAKIIFTSILDARYGMGGTFGTKEVSGPSTPIPGDWGGIYFGPTSSGSVDQAYIGFAGGAVDVDGHKYNFSPVEIQQAQVRVANSVFEHNTGDIDPGNRDGHGPVSAATMFVRGAQPVIINNVIRDNPSPAISINVNALNSNYVVDWGRSRGETRRVLEYADNRGPMVRGNLMDQNRINGMIVRGGTLTTQGIWDDTDIAHVVRDEIIVTNHQTYSGLRLQSSGTESLVVKLDGPAAGFTAMGEPGDVSDRLGGSLQIVGTPGFPVVLTALADDTQATGLTPERLPLYDTNGDGQATGPTPGLWRSVRLEAYTNDRNVQVYEEMEPGTGLDRDANSDPAMNGEWLGELTTEEDSGDDNVRLGYEIHGSIRFDDPRDMDVYAFKAQPGTEIWIDVDRTMHALDTVVELIDANGIVLASSDNSFAEEFNYQLRQYHASSNTLPLVDGHGLGGVSDSQPRTQDKDSWVSQDDYTTNARDAGFRVVLPGPVDADPRIYYVRVLSSSSALLDFAGDGSQFADGQQFTLTVEGNEVGFEFDSGGGVAGDNIPVPLMPLLEVPGSGWPFEDGDWFTLTADGTEVRFEFDGGGSVAAGSVAVPIGTATDVQKSIVEAINWAHGNLNLNVMARITADTGAAKIVLSGSQAVLNSSDPALLSLSSDIQQAIVGAINQAHAERGLNATARVVVEGEVVKIVLGGAEPTLAAGTTSLELQQRPTRGAYQFQVRLRQTQDLPGSNLRYADIRYATNGVELIGLPTHSPLLGETGEAGAPGGATILTLAGPDNDIQLVSAFAGTQYANVNIIFVHLAGVGNNPLATFAGNTLTVTIESGVTTANDIINAILAEGTFIAQLDLTYENTNTGAGTVTSQGRVGTTALVTLDNNDTLATAQYIGNLLESDRDTILVSGQLNWIGDTVDWYSFTLDHEDMQDIIGPSGTGMAEYTPQEHFWSTMFDIDYADGIERPDTTIWVFDYTGELIYRSGNSNSVDDRSGPNQGLDADDLFRGSFGGNDPLLGNVFLQEGKDLTGEPYRYYVAVTGSATNANAINQGQGRLEPIRSVRRVAEEHIEFLPPDVLGLPELPSRLGPAPERFNLADVPLFVLGGDTIRNGIDVYLMDPFTGAFEDDLTGSVDDVIYGPDDLVLLPGVPGGYRYGDLVMRDDGHLVSLSRLGAPAIDSDTMIGRLREFSREDGSLLYDQDDTIETYQVVNNNVADANAGVRFDAMTIMPASIDGPGGPNLRLVYAVGSRPDALGVDQTRNIMYWMTPDGIAHQPQGVGKSPRLGTDIIPLAELLTSLTIFTSRATDIDFPIDSYGQDITDGMTITITDAATLAQGGPNTLTFEFDSGPDVRFLQNSSRIAMARDGDTFMLGDGSTNTGTFGPAGTRGTIFELESGPVLVVGDPQTGYQGMAPGITFNITEAPSPTNQPGQFHTFEFVLQGTTPVNPTNVPIPFTYGMTGLQLTQEIVSAINGASWNYAAGAMADFVLDQDAAVPPNQWGRISLLWDASFQLGPGASRYITRDGEYRQNPPGNTPTVLVPFEETWSSEDFGRVLEAVVTTNNLPPNLNIVPPPDPNLLAVLNPGYTGTNVFGAYQRRDLPLGWAPFDANDSTTWWRAPMDLDRITFTNAVDYGFAALPASLDLQLANADNDMTLQATLPGLWYNGIEVMLAYATTQPAVTVEFREATPTVPPRLVIWIDPLSATPTTANDIINALAAEAPLWLHANVAFDPAGSPTSSVLQVTPRAEGVPQVLFDHGSTALRMRVEVEATSAMSVNDGRRFRIMDGDRNWQTFEWDMDGIHGANWVSYQPNDTARQMALNVVAAVNALAASYPPGTHPVIASMDPNPTGTRFYLEGLQVEFDPWETPFTADSRLLLLGQPGNQFSDGQTFTLEDGANDGSLQPVIYEMDANGVVAPGHARVIFNAGMTARQVAQAIMNAIRTEGSPLRGLLDPNESGGNSGMGIVSDLGSQGFTWGGLNGVPMFNHWHDFDPVTGDPLNGRPSEVGIAGSSDVAIPFDANDDRASLAAKIAAAIDTGQNVLDRFIVRADLQGDHVQLIGASAVSCYPPPPVLMPLPPASPPPIWWEGEGLGGDITGMTWIGSELYCVDDLGGLYRVYNLHPVTQRPDTSLGYYNFDPWTNDQGWDTVQRQPGRGPQLEFVGAVGGFGTNIPFSGLTAGPQTVENGAFASTLFATASDGRLYAFDLSGDLRPIFTDGATSVNLNYVENPVGLAFSNIDFNLWHATLNRSGDEHGIYPARDFLQDPALVFDRDRTPGTFSLWFGLEAGGGYSQLSANDPMHDPNSGDNDLGTYDIPGGTYGSFTTGTFSLKGYAPADSPTLYFTYFLNTEDDTLTDPFRDVARVYISNDGANWDLIADNVEPGWGIGNLVRNTGDWRQARLNLGGYVGMETLRLRFDFSTNGDRRYGPNPNPLLDNIDDRLMAGELFHTVSADKLTDGDQFAVGDLYGRYPVEFEIDMGYSIYAPLAAGRAIEDGETFTIRGSGGSTVVYEFDKDQNWDPAHVRIILQDDLNAVEVATLIYNAVSTNPPQNVTPFLVDTRVWLRGATDLRGRYALGLNATTSGGTTLAPATATIVLGDDNALDLTPTKIALVGVHPTDTTDPLNGLNYNGIRIVLVQRSAVGDQAIVTRVGTTITIDLDPAATRPETIVSQLNAVLAGDFTASIRNVDADIRTGAVVDVPLIDPLTGRIMTDAEVARRVAVSIDQVFTGNRDIVAVDGTQFADGMNFSVSDGTTSVLFEVNMGLKLVVPQTVTPAALDNQTFTVYNQAGNSVVFEFDNGTGTTTPPNVPINVVGLDAAQIAQAIRTAILGPAARAVLGWTDPWAEVRIVGTREVHLREAIRVDSSVNLQVLQFVQGDPVGAVGNPNAVEVRIQQTDTPQEVAQAIATAINNAAPGRRLAVQAHDTGSVVSLAGRIVHFEPLGSPLTLNGSADDPNLFTSTKVDRALVHMLNHVVTNRGPFAYATWLEADYPELAMPDVMNPFHRGQRANDRNMADQFEGWYIDDLIIGSAERGEMVVNVTNDNSFAGVGNPWSSITSGNYQLEIRRGTEFGPGGMWWDSNNRFREGITLHVPRPQEIAHGDTFTISDGVNSVTYEFLEPNLPPPGQGVPIYFRPTDTAASLAAAISNAINTAVPLKNVSATLNTSSQRVDLFGAAWVEGIDYVIYGDAYNTDTFPYAFPQGKVDITDVVDAADPAAGNILRDEILGQGITPIGQAVYVGGDTRVGQDRSSGIWTDTVNTGIILTTGDVETAKPNNTDDASTGMASGQGDATLDAAFGTVTRDTSSLEFTFMTGTGNLVFDFVFASEEYNEYAPDQFADAFGIFVDGVNYAFVGGTSLPVSVNNVNQYVNNLYYVNNDPTDGGMYLEEFGFDGFTMDMDPASPRYGLTLQAVIGGLDPTVPHTIKIAISDVGDFSRDSAVLIRGGSFTDQQSGYRVQPIWNVGGDQNQQRDQGWTIVEGNAISNVAGWGIYVDSGVRDGQGADWAHPSTPAPLRKVNTLGLVPGVTLQNNLLFNNGLGGIYFGGDPVTVGEPVGAVPFGRIVNNTIYGNTANGYGASGTGIQVGPNASPTILNNLVTHLATGVQIDPSSNTTELGAMIYQNLGRVVDWPTVPPGRNPLGEESMILSPNTPLYVRPEKGNFYLLPETLAIDNSVESMNERAAMHQVRQPLGIADSPIKAPQVDLYGQVRRDDASYSPPTGPGSGGNVFADRGAIERVDREGPQAGLLNPVDNDALMIDRNRALNDVFLVDKIVTNFQVQLGDPSTESVTGLGTGIADYTVVDDQQQIIDGRVILIQDGIVLEEGLHYIATYNSTQNTIRLSPVAGIWTQGSTYIIVLNNDPDGIRDLADNPLQPNRPVPLDPTVEPDDPDYFWKKATTYFTITFSGLDYGDAPDHMAATQELLDAGYPAQLLYPTNRDQLSDGARHVNYPHYHLGGTSTDNDPVGQPHVGALGDDLAGVDDEDGIQFNPPALVANPLGATQSQLIVTVTADSDVLPYDGGYLHGWFDWDHSGTWEAGELQTWPVAHGVQTLTLTVPSNAKSGPLFTRFRFTSQATATTTGELPDGEVEDYVVEVVDFFKDYGDAPDASVDPLFHYPTRRIDGGAWHRHGTPLSLGATAGDIDPNGQPHVQALGDDLAGVDDEDGVNLTNVWFFADQTVNVPVTVTNTPGTTAYLNAWFDFNGDGDWDDVLGGRSEHAVQGMAINVGAGGSWSGQVPVQVPAGVPRVAAFARFRVSTQQNLPYTGGADDGEVEDHQVFMVDAIRDYGDAPRQYGTLYADNGVRHILRDGIGLGAVVDAEFDGIPSDDAMGDDTWLPGAADDEDGVHFDTRLVPGEVAEMTVTLRNTAGDPGYLIGWLDFNHDGDWADPGETIVDRPLAGGTHTVAFLVPPLVTNPVPGQAYSTLGDTYARFRYSSTPITSPTGEAPDGEVEDYGVRVEIGQSSISGRKYDDLNGDGIRQQNEPGLGGVVVYIDLNGDGQLGLDPDGEPEPRVTTSYDNPLTTANEAGHYEFIELFSGNYTVREIRPNGWAQTFPNANVVTLPNGSYTDYDPVQGGWWEVTLGSMETLSGVDFRNFRATQVSVSDAAIAEGNVGYTQVVLEFTLSGSFGVPVTIDYSTADGDGTYGPAATVANNDYVPSTGSVTIPAQPTPPATWDIVQLTDNDYNNYEYQMSGSRIVWEGYDAQQHDWEIYLYDGGTVTQLTDNDVDDRFPSINGDNIVWSQWDGQDYEVWLLRWDEPIDPDNPDDPNPRQLSFNSVDDQDARVSDDAATWRALYPNNGGAEIYYYRFAQAAVDPGYSPVLISAGQVNEEAPQIAGQNVVWTATGGTDLDIYLFNGATTVPLTTNTTDDRSPQIYGDRVVWEGLVGQDTEVFLYRLDDGTTTALTNNSHDDRQPRVSDQYVVWEGFDGNDWEIFLADAETGLPLNGMNISNNQTQDGAPDIDGNRVVWQSYDGNDWEIFYYLIGGGQGVMNVSNNGTYDWYPQVSEELILWRGFDGNDYEVYAATYVEPQVTVSISIPVQIVGDVAVEPDETFFVNITGASIPIGTVGGVVVADNQAVVAILNDDGGATGLDYGDASDPRYPTLLSSNGARHVIATGFYLGTSVDAEGNGRPNATATGDDSQTSDDENGVTLPAEIRPGSAATVSVTAAGINGTRDGLLDAWIDFNRDGDWSDPGEKVFVSQELQNGVNSLTFGVPFSAKPGTTFARFRYSSAGGLAPTGNAMDGEVEDYTVVIGQPVPFRTVTIPGTAGDDRFKVAIGPTYWVTVNDVAYEYRPEEVDEFVFDGGAGNDTAIFLGDGGNQTAELRNGFGRFLHPGLTVNARGVEYITATGGGGHDTAIFGDSVGDDTITLYGKQGTLKGPGMSHTAKGFAEIYAYATNGGFDTAKLIDSTGDDTFIATPTLSTLQGNGFLYQVRTFDTVHAFADSGGNDRAEFHDSAADDLFVGLPAASRMAGTGYFTRAKNFDTVSAFSSRGGYDRAKLYDSTGDEQFYASPMFGSLEGATFKYEAQSFDAVFAFASGGFDTAELIDSSGNDIFWATPQAGVLYSTSYYNRANAFDSVHAKAVSGGSDEARMYDSTGDDSFVATPSDASMWSGTRYRNRAQLFDFVYAYGNNGGSNQAELHGSDGTDTYIGQPDKSTLYGNGYFLRTKSFQDVKVYGERGINDMADLYDTAAADEIEADANWVRMFGQSPYYSQWLSDFDRVTAWGTGTGNSRRNAHAVDFLFYEGNWDD